MFDFSPQIIRANRRTMAMQVLPDATLVVKVPLRVSERDIQKFILQNTDWIEKHMAKAKERGGGFARRYEDGEKFLYLGKEVTLTIGDYPAIHVRGDTLYYPVVLAFRIKKELPAWFLKQGREIISRQLEQYAQEMKATYTDLAFTDTKSQWGRCTHDNRLQFNWRLVMAPLLTINYVVVHELAHTSEKNHSRAFWSTVRRFNPSYRQQIKWLHENQGRMVV